MRVLVTGSSGFLAKHVALHLGSERELDVLRFDLRQLPGNDVPTIVGDLCDDRALERACEGVDAVVHFGAIGDVDVATRDPDLAQRTNVLGTRNVAKAAAAAGARVVYASTWEVYGPVVYQPVDEQHPCAPHHVYGITKLGGEEELREAHRHRGLPVVVLRLGTAYGPGMRPNTVFRRFADAAQRGESLQVQGSGAQWRQFTHTSDIARAVRAALASGLDCDTLNVVADELVTIRQLAELVSVRYGVPVSFGPERPGDPPSARITSEKAAELLDWQALVEFRRGLDLLLDQLDQEHLQATSGREGWHA
jgi:UDP-glucose 4-epimerase